jgi:hypothetical protein
LIQSCTAFADDKLDKLSEQRDFQNKAGLNDALNLSLEEFLAGIDVLLVTAKPDKNLSDENTSTIYKKQT